MIVDRRCEQKGGKPFGRFALPIEVNPFGLEATRRAIAHVLETHGLPTTLRLRTAAKDKAFVTDGGHFILDAELGAIDAPEALASALVAVPGVVEHGLFIGLATGAVLAGEDGLLELGTI